jgi:ATP-dependent Clp protease ATP-binding subunit ClpC
MTSNVGARKFSEFGTGIGFQTDMSNATMKAKMETIIRKELKNKFPPEFLNRLDDMILFDQLSEDSILKIIDIELADVTERLLDQNISLKFTKAAKVFLAKEGYDIAYGARPLKRAIQSYVEDLLADAIIEKTIEPSDEVFYTITHLKDDNKLSFKF